MIAFIFVYQPAKFGVQGAEPIKRFQLDPTNRPVYLASAVAIPAGAVELLEQGIYATSKEGGDWQFSAAEPSQQGTAFDIALADKDPWPSIIDVKSDGSNLSEVERSQRIRETFPGVTDANLQQYAPINRNVG